MPSEMLYRDFLCIFVSLCSVSMGSCFYCNTKTSFFDTAKFIVILVVLKFKRFY